MAGRKDIARTAERVLVGLATIDQMCRAARLRRAYVDVDVSTLAFEIEQIVDSIVRDAVEVSAGLQRARVVKLRVIE